MPTFTTGMQLLCCSGNIFSGKMIVVLPICFFLQSDFVGFFGYFIELLIIMPIIVIYTVIIAI